MIHFVMKIRLGLVLIALLGVPSWNILSAPIEPLLDSTFAPQTVRSLSALALEPDGRMLIATNLYTTGREASIIRLDTNGATDAGFVVVTASAPPNNGCGPVINALLPTEQAIFIGGDFATLNGATHALVGKISYEGVLDQTFKSVLDFSSGGCTAGVRSMALQPDGKVLIAGLFRLPGQGADSRLARLNPDGSVDTTFSLSPKFGPGYVVLNAIALQSDGKLILAGRFGPVNGFDCHSIVRFNPDGEVDPTFLPSVSSDWHPYGWIASVIVQPDTSILLGGSFQFANGLRRDGLARIRADGSLDSSFYAGDASYETVDLMTLQPDGKVLVGGQGDWNGQIIEGVFVSTAN
jgi:uncharacterized delta-60 repeat protein